VVFVGLLLFYVLVASGHVQTYDVAETISVSQQWADTGHFWITGYPPIPGGGSVAGVGGHLYAAHDIGMSLLFLPVSLLQHWGLVAPTLANLLYTLLDPLVVALTCTVFFLFQFRLTGRRGVAVASALILGLATVVLPYAHVAFDAAPTMFLTLLCFYLLYRAQAAPVTWRYLAAGCAAGGTVLLRVDSAILVAVACLWVLVRLLPAGLRAAKDLVAWFLPLVAALAVTMAYDWTRFGSVTDNGHHDDPATKLAGSLLTGLAGQLVSPGKGIVFFAPVVVVALLGWRRFAREQRWFAGAVGLAALGYLVFHAMLVNWSGAQAWGPRFLVPVFPLIMLPLGYVLAGWAGWGWLRRGAVAVLVVAGFGVNLPGILTDDVAVDLLHGGTAQATAFHDSQIGFGWQVVVRSLRGGIPYPSNLEGGVLPPPVPRLDLWWLGGWSGAVHHPTAARAVAALLALAVVVAAAGCAMAVRRSLSGAPSRPAAALARRRAAAPGVTLDAADRHDAVSSGGEQRR
jgi:hypothetical protein